MSTTRWLRYARAGVRALCVGAPLWMAGATAGATAPGPVLAGSAAPSAWELAARACGCDDARGELAAEAARLEAAPDLEASRARALAHTRRAGRALSRAAWLAPWSESLEEARERIARYEARVAEARSQTEVAEAFRKLTRVADISVDIDDDDDGEGCHWSTGEVIAIVLGLILGIIPGIILAILLC